MKKVKKILYDIVILVMPVMLGVYLGLLANNWNEAKKEKQQTQKILNNLIREIDHNYEVTQESLFYFKQLRDSIYYLSDKTIPPSRFSFWKGLNPPLLKRSSFESATLSGILANLDFEIIEELSTVYGLQDDLKEQSNTYIYSITNKIGSSEFDNHKYLIILENYSHDQISSEEVLAEQLAKTKKILAQNLH